MKKQAKRHYAFDFIKYIYIYIYSHICIYSYTHIYMHIASVSYCCITTHPNHNCLLSLMHLCITIGMWIGWNSSAPHVSHPPQNSVIVWAYCFYHSDRGTREKTETKEASFGPGLRIYNEKCRKITRHLGTHISYLNERIMCFFIFSKVSTTKCTFHNQIPTKTYFKYFTKLNFCRFPLSCSPLYNYSYRREDNWRKKS